MSAIIQAFSTFAGALLVFALACLLLLWAVCWGLSIWRGDVERRPGYTLPLLFDVADIQPDEDSPGLWIGFKTAAQRTKALKWFRVDAGQSGDRNG